MTIPDLPALAERLMTTSSDMRWLAGQTMKTQATAEDIARHLEAAQDSINHILIALTDTDTDIDTEWEDREGTAFHEGCHRLAWKVTLTGCCYTGQD